MTATRTFLRVRCTKEDPQDVTQVGEHYTVTSFTKEGNFLLMECDPPDPYNCFDSNRFVEEGLVHFDVDYDQDLAYEEEYWQNN